MTISDIRVALKKAVFIWESYEISQLGSQLKLFDRREVKETLKQENCSFQPKVIWTLAIRCLSEISERPRKTVEHFPIK